MLGVNRNDQTTSGVGSPEATDHARRLSNVARYGTVAEVDYSGATAGFPAIRVALQDGAILTDWMPWFSPRAGNDRVWDPPEVNEVVMVLAPSGELSAGVAIPGLFSDGNANGDRAGLNRRTYQDGTVVEYDRQNHRMFLDVKGDISIKATGNVEIEAEGNVTIIGARIDLNP